MNSHTHKHPQTTQKPTKKVWNKYVKKETGLTSTIQSSTAVS